MEELKDRILDFIEDLKNWDISFSDLFDLSSSNSLIYLVIFLSILFYWFVWYSFYNDYLKFKRNYLDSKILEYNNEVLSEVYSTRKKEIKKINLIEIPKINNIDNYYLLTCMFLKLNPSIFVNKKFYITNIDYQKSSWKFNIWIQWIKYYDDLIRMLLITKLFKTNVKVDRYSVNLVTENNWSFFTTYYDVRIWWKVNNSKYDFSFANVANSKERK